MKNLLLTFGAMCVLLICSCTYDNLDAPVVTPVDFCDTIPATYDLNINTIVQTNCAYTGCHFNGYAPGDFSTYAGMLSRLENGEIEDRVISKEDDPTLGMPPDYASGPKDLTPEELDIFSCWLEAEYPEN